jgi:hypothetical protein
LEVVVMPLEEAVEEGRYSQTWVRSSDAWRLGR